MCLTLLNAINSEWHFIFFWLILKSGCLVSEIQMSWPRLSVKTTFFLSQLCDCYWNPFVSLCLYSGFFQQSVNNAMASYLLLMHLHDTDMFAHGSARSGSDPIFAEATLSFLVRCDSFSGYGTPCNLEGCLE